jgi:glycosyltransferase involved in cell wall biosynthesis
MFLRRKNKKSTSNDKPVIAVVSDSIYPYMKGGKEVRYDAITAQLASLGFEVHVFTMHWWEGPKHIERNGVQLHAISELHSLYDDDRRSIAQAVKFSIACFRMLRYDFDILEADHMPYIQLYPLRLIAWIKGVPLYVTWHEVWGLKYWNEYLGNKGFIAAAIERVAMNLPNRIFAASSGTAERLHLRRGTSKRVVTLPNGVDMQRIRAVEPSAQKFDILCVSRLLSHKNVDLLLQAVEMLHEDGVELTLGIVGQGPELDRLKALSSQLGLDEFVTFLGTVEGEDSVYELMKSAKVVAMPSVREGFGLVVLEALACGTPVVTTNHSDNHARLLVEDGVDGVLCNATSGDVATAIQKALELKDSAAHSSHRLGWDDVAEEIVEHYLKGSK